VLTFVVSDAGSASGNRICGNAARFTFQTPFDVNAIDEDRDYYLEFKFNGFTTNSNLGSGLTAG